MPPRIAVKSADELAQIGLRHHRAGDLAQAERSYRAALERGREHVGALTLLSSLLLQRREHAAAVELLQRATRLAPQVGVLHSNLGEALRRLDRKPEALEAFERAVQLSPELAEAHYNLGLLLDQLGRLPDAIAAYESALELKPELPGALVTLLAALRERGEYLRAVSAHRRWAAAVPDSAELRCGVASALCDVFRIDEAVEHLQRALELDPSSARAHSDLAIALAERGEIKPALEHLRRAIALEPQNATHQSHLIYLLAFSEETRPCDVLDSAREFGRCHADAVPRLSLAEPALDPQRRLRVGYVSADFRKHPVALFFEPLLEHHDRARLEIFCYSSVKHPDATTTQLQQRADGWRDISALDDASAAELVRSDQIDVLIDLSQHSAGNRLLLFARKPAPLQLTWLGYPGTTGVSAIDYRLTDPELDPPERGNPASTEQLLRLPETFWCYAPPAAAPEVNELPSLSRGCITFGSMNSFKKVSNACLELWARVLGAVPDSRLLLVAPPGKARERVQRAMKNGGVDPARVELLGHVSHADYLATYARIDICLDTVPYNGGTTTLDALWMGVPVVTLAGELPTARAGASLLKNLGLDEGVAHSADDYVRAAQRWSNDTSALSRLRQGLRERFRASPLAQSSRFAALLERELLSAWNSRTRY